MRSQLSLNQMRIYSFLSQQLRMRPLFSDLPLFQNNNPIAVDDSRQSVSNNYQSSISSTYDTIDSLLHLILTLGI